MKADLVISNIGQLLTCASGGQPKRGSEMCDVGIIEGGGVAITDGKFLAIGKSEEIAARYSAIEAIDAKGKVVCPGFVDPHTHVVWAGDRLDDFELKINGADYLEILASGGGILSTVRKTRAATVDELVSSGIRRLDEMLACGTTTAEIKTGYGLDRGTELKMLDSIVALDLSHPIDVVPTFLAAHAIPPEFKNRSNDYIDLICEQWLLDLWNWYTLSHFFDQGVPCFVDVFCENGAFDLGQTKKLFEAVIENKFFGIKAHVDEFSNLGGSRMAISMGATSIDHLDEISDDEINLLAASDTIGVVTPTVNFNLGRTDFADARKMIDAGCAIALSTDYNPGSAPCPSQPMTMAIACRYQKLLPAEALNAGTINASFAIGSSDKYGSIEIGKAADLVISAVTDYRMLAYEFGGDLVDTVIKTGKIYDTREIRSDGNRLSVSS